MALTDEGNGGMVMPVAPMYGNGGGFGNGFGGDGWWIILLFVLLGGFGNGRGGQGGGNTGSNSYYSRAGRGRGSYARGSYARGRNARRDSRGRYSGDGGIDEFMWTLGEMMGDFPEEAKRDAEKLMRKLEEMQ